VLDRQAQAFMGGERVADMVLGTAAICERIAALVGPRRSGGSAPPSGDESLALAILGALSLRRSLWATLALDAKAAAAAAPEPAPAAPPAAGLLR
jgi:hypothetical protein